jgi:NADH-quinone oxidoreductase subunit J
VSQVLFFIAGFGAIAGAVGVVMLRDPFYCVLALVAHLISLALLFLLLRSEFVAAVQVVVYAGAVMVLYVFVVAYVGDEQDTLAERLRGSSAVGSGTRAAALLAGMALLVELLIALLGTGLKAVDGKGAPYAVGTGESHTFGTPAYIGQLLLTRFLLVFEVASFLLLIAAVGAVVLARRRGGLEQTRAPLGALDVRRPPGTGTMAEAVDGLEFAVAHLRGEQDECSPAHAEEQASPSQSPLSAHPTEGGW